MGRVRRYGAQVYRTRAWATLRLRAKRRDGWACVQCGARGRLEVDHVKPIRDRPDLALELANVQTLCPRHHAQKTRLECGHPELSPARQAWRDLLKKPRKELKCSTL